jgi:hypothetical protein
MLKRKVRTKVRWGTLVCHMSNKLQNQLLCGTQGYTHFYVLSIKGTTLYVDNLKESNK